MDQDWKRRDFLTLMGLGGLVFASGLAACSKTGADVQAPAGGTETNGAKQDFFFLQLSDTHWGYKGQSNPQADLCLRQTVAAINAVDTRPDFIVFTGDLTHKTDDPKERRARMTEFREITSRLKVKNLVFLPGEHDAAADRGEVYRQSFGELHQSFNHKGVHFIALDNASAPEGEMGDAQLDWLVAEVARVPAGAPLVVLAHRPLFDLYPQWEWATKDGARAIEVLSRRDQVTVFYGHIHQENHHMTGNIAHHSARSLVFPLPGPGAAPEKVPLPWDTASRDHGLGHRAIAMAGSRPVITEVPFVEKDASVLLR